MKKLLVLPAIGAAAALTYGAAAALNVNQNAAPIQVGSVTDLACAEEVRVQAWGFNHHEDPTSVAYATVDVLDNNGNCAGGWLYVTPLDEEGDILPLASGTGWNGPTDGTGIVELGGTDGWSQYKVYFGHSPSNPWTGASTNSVDAVALEGVQIAVDQGHQDWNPHP